MPFVQTSNYVNDGTGHVPPKLGGTLAVLRGTITHEDTSATTLFTLPQGAIVADYYLNVSENFNDSTTDVISVGTSDSGTAIIDTADVSSTTVLRFGGTDTAEFAQVTEQTDIVAVYAGGTGDADQGIAEFVCFYYLFQ